MIDSEHLERRLDGRRVGIQGWAEALRNERIRGSVVEGISIVPAAIVRLIQRGQHTGQIRVGIDPDATARVLIATFQGLVLQAAWGEAVDLRACGQVMRDMIRHSMLTPAGRASFEP
ncbi:MAG TPA: TetR family transcriptional regulator C-terminal domain-containing protein [Caulobacteraceae bacterium]|nr:TetR family transcriptional regulator C-terminal domain-containing protein [Caulobacteraceae bacterium]